MKKKKQPKAHMGAAHFGLFETDSQVRTYASRVDAQIESLQSDLLRSKIALTDPAFASSWASFYVGWKKYKDDIDNSSFIIMSANAYRDVEKYDVDAQAWRKQFEARNVPLSAPPLTQGAAIPGITAPTNPNVETTSLAGEVAGGLVKSLLVVGAGYLAFNFLLGRIERASRMA